MSGQLTTCSCRTLEQDTPIACLFPPPGSTKLLPSGHPQRSLLTLDIPQPLKGGIRSTRRGSYAMDREPSPTHQGSGSMPDGAGSSFPGTVPPTVLFLISTCEGQLGEVGGYCYSFVTRKSS